MRFWSKQISTRSVKVADLYCGIGGLSFGFAKRGFKVTGFDINKNAGKVYRLNGMGDFKPIDLTKNTIPSKRYEVMVGGPPCEPWSCLNLTKRRTKHESYGCVDAFFQEVRRIRPLIFVMENVPSIKNDPTLKRSVESITTNYDCCSRTIDYSQYGAAFARQRLFITGTKSELQVSASELIDGVRKGRPKPVKKAIKDLRNKERDESIDHVWPNLKTIRKYRKNYKTHKYGWYILDWNEPSPSFGNITKTYILHPDSSFDNGARPRAISVREALRIVGFPDGFRFPSKITLGMKYEMISDAVSPVFSCKLADRIGKVLKNHKDSRKRHNR